MTLIPAAMRTLTVSLRPGGVLFLGPAGNAGAHDELFTDVDRKSRIFRRTGETVRMPGFPSAGGELFLDGDFRIPTVRIGNQWMTVRAKCSNARGSLSRP